MSILQALLSTELPVKIPTWYLCSIILLQNTLFTDWKTQALKITKLVLQKKDIMQKMENLYIIDSSMYRLIERHTVCKFHTM